MSWDRKPLGHLSKARLSNTNLDSTTSPRVCRWKTRSRSTTGFSQKERERMTLEIRKESCSRTPGLFDPFKYVEKRNRNKVGPLPLVPMTTKSCQSSTRSLEDVEKKLLTTVEALSSGTRKSYLHSSFTNLTGSNTTRKTRPKSALPADNSHLQNEKKKKAQESVPIRPSTLQSARQSYHGFTRLMTELKPNRKPTPKTGKLSDGPAVTVETTDLIKVSASDHHDMLPRRGVVKISFQERNREFQRKREQKIKTLVSEEEMKMKVRMVFQARPVPSLKKPMLPVRVAREPTTKPCPFSFEERDKKIAKKKEESMRNVMAQDKIGRTFHARPAPHFASTAIIIGVNPLSSRKSMEERRGSRVPLLSAAKTDRENYNPLRTPGDSQQHLENNAMAEGKLKRREVTKILREFHMNSLNGARDRREFDDGVKRKGNEMELLRKEMEMQRSENNGVEMGKMEDTVKARPIIYKPPRVNPGKHLAEPYSPDWAVTSKY